MKKQFYKILLGALLFGAFYNGFSQTGTGLTGHYYQDNYTFVLTDWTASATEVAAYNPPTNISWFTTLVSTRVDPTLNVASGGGLLTFLSSVTNLNPQNPVSIRWTGYIEFSTVETYSFYLSGADGLRLKINGQNVIGTFGASDHSWVVRPYLTVGGQYSALSGTLTVSQNQLNTKLPIVIEYYSVGATANSSLNDRGIQLSWQSNSIGLQIVPQSQLYPDGSQGINDKKIDEQLISIYPNPATDQLTVISKQLSMNEVQITDIQGRIVYQYNESFTGTKTIDISGLQSGVYFVKFVNGNNCVTKKFVKK